MIAAVIVSPSWLGVDGRDMPGHDDRETTLLHDVDATLLRATIGACETAIFMVTPEHFRA